MRWITFLILLSISSAVTSAEADYQLAWCKEQNGVLTKGVNYEVVVQGGRIDCLTDRYAVEVGFASHWKEDIAQARWYAMQTGKIPAVLMIVDTTDWKYVEYVEDYLAHYDIYLKMFIVPK